ncbi:MAG: succinylglutamate desuccinylase/aspartoacylase family protein [Hydrogenophaga sp.]|uniref:succinylglutamate desuccinylase/aspartoacylase domain-containing protein n=1 Tax=Hydrogenophaga sp. TaxID=1904254 RepID=UPI00260D9E7D|nr:succinylglutamate desuccinylase/aspartoacylase family protein [Hydrogenophaga sp.]MCV0438708.1 succinylglutamate desuccinylase/aspartoacylase family protein [Hydrogenophaga sp.]
MTDLHFELARPDIGAWRAGNTGTEGVWHFDSGVPGRAVMVASLVHGNELCGAWAVKGLLEAGVRPQRGSLTLAFCNLAAFDRFDPAAFDASRFVDEDLNRQWSTGRIAEGGTLERRRAGELLPFVQRAQWLLDLHSMHEPGKPLMLTGPHHRNLALARSLRAPEHIVVDEGHRDGTRMRDFGHFGLADPKAGDNRSLLVECGFHGDTSSRDVACDVSARFLVEAQVLDAGTAADALAGWRRADAPRQCVLRVTGGVTARSDRFRFLGPCHDLQLIHQAGTAIGDNDGEIVTTPYDDCVLVMPSARQARAGVTVVRFARAESL